MADKLLLTSKEKLAAIKPCRHKGEWLVPKLVDEVAKAQLAKAKPIIEKQERQRIIEWGIERCPHWSDERTKEVGVMKRDCSLCWQALKEGK